MFTEPIETILPPKPNSLTCAVCGKQTDWVWDEKEQEWDLDGEWWYDPSEVKPRTGYLDSLRCYRRSLESH